MLTFVLCSPASNGKKCTPTSDVKHKLLSNGMEEMTSRRCHDNTMYLMDPLA